jgi:putative FmdB family regulatory protein
MPIYGYACKSCEHTFDALQKISDDPLVDCPDCGDASLQKQLSAPKFRLKGKGWYETDFKTGDKRNLHSEKGSKAKDTDSSTKTEKKSEKKSGSKADSA